jgi:hypothetical protein
MNMGFAWRETFEDGWGRDAVRQAAPRGTRLVGATTASVSVFRALLRRPAGGTVVVLVPRSATAAVGSEDIVIDDQLRAS